MKKKTICLKNEKKKFSFNNEKKKTFSLTNEKEKTYPHDGRPRRTEHCRPGRGPGPQGSPLMPSAPSPGKGRTGKPL